MKGGVASVVPLGPLAVAVAVAVVFFAWGWARAARFLAERGKPPWSIPPTVWGAIHVALLPIGWLVFWAASRTTRVADFSLTYRPNTSAADTAEEREKLRRIRFELPLLRPPQPASRGWHPDPLHQRNFRFFDGKQWTRDVSDDPAQEGGRVSGRSAAPTSAGDFGPCPPPADLTAFLAPRPARQGSLPLLRRVGLDRKGPRGPLVPVTCSGGRARTSNIRLQRPTFCRLNYPGRNLSRCIFTAVSVPTRHLGRTRRTAQPTGNEPGPGDLALRWARPAQVRLAFCQPWDH